MGQWVIHFPHIIHACVFLFRGWVIISWDVDLVTHPFSRSAAFPFTAFDIMATPSSIAPRLVGEYAIDILFVVTLGKDRVCRRIVPQQCARKYR